MGKYLVINIRSNIVSYCGFGLYLYYKYSIKCRTQICGQCQTLFYLSKLRFMRTIQELHRDTDSSKTQCVS